MLDTFIFTLLILVWAFQLFFFFVPLGNERSMVRRLPLITFSILALNTIIYFVSLPVTVQQDKAREKATKQIKLFIDDNREILADSNIRQRLKETGLFRKEIDSIEQKLKEDATKDEDYKRWLKGATATQLRKDIKPLFEDYDAADEAHLYNKYGVVRDGKWKTYQLLSYSFIHANSRIFGLIFPLHLFFNLITLFAVGFSVEDLWGRDLFLLFYLAAAIVASIPDAISGTGLIGASGAVSAIMGAFLVRLPSTKIKLGWVSLPLAVPMMIFGKKPFGVAKVASYYYLAFFFLNQLLLWWFFNYKTTGGDGVSYRCHITGFAFGVVFAFAIKLFKIEEKHINPKIEAKIAFYLSPKIASALELLDKGEEKQAEKKLHSLLSSYPSNPEILMALVQLYERVKNYPQLNEMYTLLIKHHLEKGDKEAALYAYDNLLLAFPDNKIEPNIPAPDWLVLCEYLEEIDMNHEASVEYERLANFCTDIDIMSRACVQGGEAAFETGDLPRAIRLFEKIAARNINDSFAARARLGLEQAQWQMNRRTGALNTGALPNVTKPLPFSSDV
jgi:membrane associated rhomboid family serine protease